MSNTQVLYVEPWLRGTHTEVPAVGRAVLHALELAAEDLHKWTEGLSNAEAHAQPLDLPSVAFHLKHIARSLDRLLTYAEGVQLSPEQLSLLKSEQDGAGTLAEAMAEVDAALVRSSERVHRLAAGDLEEARGVGKKMLPTTVGGLLVHVADHTLRHVGQVVTTAKALKNSRV